MSSRDLRRACLHEAGHALLALKLGVRLKSVRANMNGTGSAIPEDIDSENPRDVLRVAYAGIGAERLEFDNAKWHIDTNDGRIAYLAVQPLGNYQRESDAAELFMEELVRDMREQLEELAAFLGDRPNQTVPWASFEELWKRIRP
jgi:hypothetical protein